MDYQPSESGSLPTPPNDQPKRPQTPWKLRPHSNPYHLPKQGPARRGHCSHCDHPEVREGICPKHWLSQLTGRRFRRDIAEKVPIERLTARQIETIRDLPLRADWRTVRQVATTPSSEIETLAQELERALLREAFRSSALLIVGGIFGWRPRRSNRVLPPSFIIVPEQDATTRQRIIVGMTPHITEALRRGLPPHRPERNLYEALDHLDHLFSHHAHTADAEVLRWIRLETQLSLLAV